MRGQSEASQAAIAPGSRSRGTRSGFWGVKPRSLSHALRERGLNRMPNSSSISWASRRAVHNSGDGELGGPARYGASRQSLRASGPEQAEPAPDRPGRDAEELGDLVGRVTIEESSDSELTPMLQLVGGAFGSHPTECKAIRPPLTLLS